MRVIKSALVNVLMSIALLVAPVLDFAWAKDGNSGSSSSRGGNSDKGGGKGGNAKDGKSSKAGGQSKKDSRNNHRYKSKAAANKGKQFPSGKRPLAAPTVETHAKRPSGSAKRDVTMISFAAESSVIQRSLVEGDLARAQGQFQQATVAFNKALGDPAADLEKLEQAISLAERALIEAGAKAAKALAVAD